MRILMVRPRPSRETIGLQHLMVVEPLELEILSALRRPGDEVLIVDMILEKKPLEYFIDSFLPDVFCVTGYITNVATMIGYCEIIKNWNAKAVTIVGGVHCEVCPEDFKRDCVDFRVVRNAAVIFGALLDHIDGKLSLPQGVLTKSQSLEDIVLPPFDFQLPLPDREAVAIYRKRYFYIFHDKVALIKTSFGCPYTCNFCFCRVITEGRFHQRPVKDVIAELELIKEKEIYIVDDDFLVDRKWLMEFMDQMKTKGINKRFLIYGRADFIAQNPEIMEQLAANGLKTVIVGFESFSDKELDQYHKNTSVSLYKETMRVLKKADIECYATIIIPPEWDKTDFTNMVKAVKKLGLHFVNLQPLTPLPKTGLDWPENEVIIDRMEYEKWDLAHVTIQPKKMSVAQFYTEILKAYNRILFSPPVLWNHLISYRPMMLIKMLAGSIRVSSQYRRKIKEARKYA